MDPVTDQDLPQEDIIVNDDGSVDVPDNSAEAQVSEEFQENLALTLPESELTAIAGDLIDAIERDREARKKRDKQYEDGLRRTGLGDDAPGGATFEGASEVVHPVLAEACVDFAARAIKELFPPQGPVKTAVIGGATEEQLDRAERKRTYMNWQLTTQMQEYRSELEQLLTQLPLGGSQFQKFWSDDRFRRPTSEFVPIDDILLPFAAASFYTAQRVTHVQHITQFEYDKRVKSGLYRDLAIARTATGSIPERTDSATANDKIEGKEEDAYNEDGLRDVYETYCWHAIDDPLVDGSVPAPYIITTDAHSEQVLAIYRNWEEDDDNFEKLDWLIEWKFIPWRGAYAIGFPQLIGSLSAAATGALRALLDSAHINNSASLVKLKGTRQSGSNTTVEQTGVSEVEGPPGVDDIRKLMMAIPYNQTSPVLFQLLGWLTEAAKGVVRTAESAIGNVGDRTPVGTTQAMIEQGSTIYSAIHARLHESQKRALRVLCRINRTWLDEEEEIEELGKLIIRRDDFKGSLDVIPVSDPSIFSEAQRYAQNQALQQMQAQDLPDPSIPWNKIAIRRRMLKQMRIDNVDELLPAPPKPLTSDAMSEMVAVFQGRPIQAAVQQDHMSHIVAHITYLSNPTVLQNPLVQGPPLMQVLGHVQQHIQFLQQTTIMQYASQLAEAGMPQDMAIAQAIGDTASGILKKLEPIMQRIAELQQVIQKKMPPPQMPPEVQASIQIAQMDIDRKAQLDQATIGLKKAEQAAGQQLEQVRLAMDQRQEQFDNALEQQRLVLEGQSARLTAQIDAMNNRADNEQKQMTELLKNRDDNDTKTKIAMQAGFDKLQSQMATPQPAQLEQQVDLTPHIDRMQGMLDQIGKSRTDDALAVVVQGLQATLQTIQQPRRSVIEKDANGRPIAAVSTLVN